MNGGGIVQGGAGGLGGGRLGGSEGGGAEGGGSSGGGGGSGDGYGVRKHISPSRGPTPCLTYASVALSEMYQNKSAGAVGEMMNDSVKCTQCATHR